MAEILLDEQSTAISPSTGKTVIYSDSTTSKLTYRDDAGNCFTIPGRIDNFTNASQTGFAADQYLVGSNLAVPPHKLQVGTSFTWIFDVTKTGAGVATPIIQIRVGTAGSVADTSRVTFTLPAQTAVADVGLFIITAVIRNIGASGVMVGVLNMTHNVPAGITGLSTSISPNIVTVSGAFDTTVANLIVGLSVNGGASAAWTTQMVQSSMFLI